MESIKKLPIGIENFEKIRTEGFYYVDKSGLIKELLDNWGEVNLFTRPRRFGKSLNMSMLKCFFEIGCNKKLFDDLEIANEHVICEEYMGKFPVISLCLKGVSGGTFETARGMLCSVIGSEAMRFQMLFQSSRLTAIEKTQYQALVNVDSEGHFMMSDEVLINSLLILSGLLRKHYDRKVIIMIDEYDVPLDKAQQYGYYDPMVTLVRNIFNQSLKGNESLYFAILTGCLRISKESIFTGLNNPKILSITDVWFDEYFGFTDGEVKSLLSYYALSEHYEAIREWYDGYRFGLVDVYCPWDVICYCDTLRAQPSAQPRDYWSNTSDNAIVRRFIQKAQKTTTKREIELLMAGDTIRKEIHQELTYKDIDRNIDNLWSVLFTTGYLTQQGEPDGDVFQLKIPNLEIRNIFTKQIYQWFQESAQSDGITLNAFCEAFKCGNAAEIERLFNAYLMRTISIRDTFVQKQKKENLPTGKATTKGLTIPNPSVCFYHGILLGLLSYKDSWAVSSNKESGEGYSDILVEIDDEEIGIVIEVKYPDNDNLEAGCAGALKQIERLNCEEKLLSSGMKNVLKYGIACYKKHCKVVAEWSPID